MMQRRHLVGAIRSSDPVELAERAVEFAGLLSATLTLEVAADGLVWAVPPAQATEREAVATFTHRSDPDWLAEEIAFSVGRNPRRARRRA